MRNQYVGKNISELRHTIDSIDNRLDSTGGIYGKELKLTAFPELSYSRYRKDDAKEEKKDSVAEVVPVKVDTLLSKLSADQQTSIYDKAMRISQQRSSELEFKAMTVRDDKRTLRRHEIELLKKFTLSVACLVFFFIGAPLGAIIRKGGLGTPLVISVLLFLVYYIIDNTGYKMARDGHMEVWAGIWLSTFILAPLGVYVTYKAMNDSAVFDGDRYKAFISKILGKKIDRKVAYKEVIINDISVDEAIARLEKLKSETISFCERYVSRSSYAKYWDNGYDLSEISSISEELEADVDYMTDCRNALAVNKLMDYPVLRTLWLYQPGRNRFVGQAMKWFVPAGFVIYLFGLRAQNNLKGDMRKIADVSDAIVEILRKEGNTDHSKIHE